MLKECKRAGGAELRTLKCKAWFGKRGADTERNAESVAEGLEDADAPGQRQAEDKLQGQKLQP